MCAPISVWAQTDDEIPPANDEQDTFGGAAPDVLIILDLSGSMEWNPAGGTNIYAAPTDTACAGPFYSTSDGGTRINCSRVAIARRALFSVMDANNDGKIDSGDESVLNVRIGYMRFRGSLYSDGNDTGGNYASGSNKLVTEISKMGAAKTGTSYAQTYCGSSKGTCYQTSDCRSETCINYKTSPTGGTPLTASLKEAKKYLDAHKAADPGKACRKKFVIVVSDGADTFACNGSGAECQAHMYERRREVVAAAKALYDHGYKVFVIGFGSSMPAYLSNTLNWMAYHGGSDDSEVDNTGATTAYSIPRGSDCNGASPSNCCVFGTTAGTCPFPATTASACFPAGITASCQEDAAESSAVCQGSSETDFKADALDPGYLALNGYAYIASDADKLTKSLQTALSVISGESYSFTQASIQAVRTADENFIYEASFNTQSCPFWHGHLKRYTIDATTGDIITPSTWDAATVLNAQTASNRNIKTLIGGSSLVDFQTSNSSITAGHLNAADATERSNIINFIRSGDQYQTGQYWRLGDIFHSSPMSIGTPNALFYDQWDLATPKAFETYRLNHIRKSTPVNAGDGIRVMLVGANDGQLHAFKAAELGASTNGGKELWSFIPPNQLRRLKLIYHSDMEHPSEKSRQYYVDGPTSAAEIWVNDGADTAITATTKTASEWKTLLVAALGRGGTTTLWSSSTSCDSSSATDFSPYWTSTYTNYCGYYAFDVSDTADETLNWPFLWRLGATTGLPEGEGKYLGQPWSKMFIGRVRINNVEKWVGFIGGGYSGCGKAGSDGCKKIDGGPDTRGKGLFVVDLSNGDILWKYTYANNTDMNYDLVAGPAVVDYDNDGFLDRAYIGDLGGSIWRFQFCKKSDGASCSTANWTGGMFFDDRAGSGIRPIYTSAAVSLDKSYNLWVYVGSGDKTQPTRPQASDRFYAIKDRRNNGDAAYVVGDLDPVNEEQSTSVYANSASGNGWYMVFGANEKVLAEPTIFGGRLFFTTYIPSPQSDTSDPCSAPGSTNVYNLDYITAKGYWPGGEKFQTLTGTGVSSGVVVSVGPDGTSKILISTSVAGSGSNSGGTDPDGTPTPQPDDDHFEELEDANLSTDQRGSMIYWHDRRIK